MSVLPDFVDKLTLEISRLSKAIRTIQLLNKYLPREFPPPADIEASRKPFDLLLTWEAASLSHGVSLQSRISKVLGFPPGSWRREGEYVTHRGRVKLRGKVSLNLSLRIKLPERTQCD